MSIQHLHEGLDPTGLACISVADLLQMIRNAYPYDHQGWIIWSPTAPDVVTNPELSTFFWGYQADLNDDSTRTKEIYYYNGTSWELIPLELLDGDVTLPKINITGANLFDILQVIAGPTLAWVSVVSAIQDNTVPPGKLLAPDAINKYVLTCLTGTRAFRLLATFFSTDVDDNSIPTTKLIKAGADALKKWLSTKTDGSAIEWSEIDVANIAAAGYLAGQSIRRDVGNTAWEAYTPPTAGPIPVTPVNVLSAAAAPIAWTAYDATIAGVPVGASAVILQCECQVTDAGADGEIKLEVRKDSSNPTLTACHTAGVRGVGTLSSQEKLCYLKSDGTFEYRVTNTAIGTVTMTIMGYFL